MNIYIQSPKPNKQSFGGGAWHFIQFLRPKESYNTYNILSAYRALRQHLSAIGAGRHVSAFQKYALNGRIHAYLTKLICGKFLNSCKGRMRKQLTLALLKDQRLHRLYLALCALSSIAWSHGRAAPASHSIPCSRHDAASVSPSTVSPLSFPSLFCRIEARKNIRNLQENLNHWATLTGPHSLPD